ncbi:DUF378 domain-containing protein [Clostridium sp.]|uniref:DUF378 domain-containing protein n=1 Tax=Clostridium sp. TaxID=1506 RepID=UPI003217D964
MCKISLLDKISFILVIIGAINWGIFGLFNFDLIHFVFGFSDILSRSIYILVGLAGVNLIRFLYCLNKK